MKHRTHFKHRVDCLDAQGEIFEHVAGVEDFELAVNLYEAAIERWPGERIMLRQEARIIHDSHKCFLVAAVLAAALLAMPISNTAAQERADFTFEQTAIIKHYLQGYSVAYVLRNNTREKVELAAVSCADPSRRTGC
jgi:hypothetical protein